MQFRKHSVEFDIAKIMKEPPAPEPIFPSRVLIILLICLSIIGGFFLSLVLIPGELMKIQPGFDEEDGLIYGTNEVDGSEAQKAAEQSRRLEAWRAFENELTERYTDKRYAIALQSLDKPEFFLSVNADQDFIAASTYKLFAAYTMFKNDNEPQCLDVMIIYSDNDCSEKYMARYGWRNFTEDAHEIGALDTSFGEDTHTTANDLVLILSKFYDGSLLNEYDNQRLFDDMQEQVFRDGIPTGIPEAEVADKVGFLDGYLHDAGIVHSPKGDFILVILTEGYSWQSIAETAAEIYLAIDF